MEEKKISEDVSTSSFVPLFPVPISDGPSDTPGWLCNTSFTAQVSTDAAAETSFRVSYFEEEEEKKTQVKHELLSSSSPSEEESERAGETKKKKRRRRRRRESEEPRRGGGYSRKGKVLSWAGAQSGKLVKDHYIDTRGDPDILEYGSIYRSYV